MSRDLLDALRDLLYEAPSEDIWSVICALFEGHRGEEAPLVALDYAHKHLEGWPDSLRVAPETWIDTLSHGLGPPVGWPLVRHVLVQEYGGAELVGVLSGAHMASVTALSLFAVPLPPRSLAEIFASHHLDSLLALHLDATRLGDQGARILAAAPLASSLEAISLHGTGIGSDGIVALMRSERLSDPVKAMIVDQLRL